jgi:hypothetical protein
MKLSREGNIPRGRKKIVKKLGVFPYAPQRILTGEMPKRQWRPPSNKKKKMKACHNISTTLLQSVTKIGTQSTMKSMKDVALILAAHASKNVEKEHK